MNRDSQYYRYQRQRHIARKKCIIKNQQDYWHYEYDGYLSKGKIHCSCGMCSRCRKTNNKGKRRLIHGNYYPSYNPSRKDKRRIEEMDMEEYEF